MYILFFLPFSITAFDASSILLLKFCKFKKKKKQVLIPQQNLYIKYFKL